jgi:dephospho-CoA kinase
MEQINIAITGGIGSGKSSLVSMLKEHGIEVVDCDEIAHRLTIVDGFNFRADVNAILESIKYVEVNDDWGGLAIPYIYSEFGPDFILPNGNMDRKKMRELVFNNPHKMEKLNNIMGPLIMKVALADTHDRMQIYDIPLLAQSPEWLEIIDYVIVVDVPEEVQIERVMARNGHTREMVMKMISRQSTRQERLGIADYVVDNSGDLKYLRKQSVAVVEKIFSLVK